MEAIRWTDNFIQRVHVFIPYKHHVFLSRKKGLASCRCHNRSVGNSLLPRYIEHCSFQSSVSPKMNDCYFPGPDGCDVLGGLLMDGEETVASSRDLVASKSNSILILLSPQYFPRVES